MGAPTEPTEHERLAGLPPFDVAVWLTEQGRVTESGPYWQRAIAECPDDPVRLYAFGTAMGMVRRYGEAEQALWGAIALGMDRAEVWESLGIVYTRMRKLVEARQAYQRSVDCAPTVTGHIALANAYASADGDAARCRLAMERAVSCAYRTPQDAGAAAQSLLWLGQWRAGWGLYESRREQAEWRSANAEMAKLPCRPLARVGRRIADAEGNPLDGRPVVVSAEQGQGDGVQFARFVPVLVERVPGPVWFRAHSALVPMLRGAFAGDTRIRILDAGDTLAEGECQGWVPLMSLPYFLGVSGRRDVPLPVRPFGTQWSPSVEGSHVFVHESGNPYHAYDWDRSAPAYRLSRMVRDAGYVPVIAKEGADWRTTVADLEHCVRCVTVDTGLAHVAASYGIPTDVFVPSVPEWRWGCERRPESVWYPSARLWWRDRSEDWDGACQRWTDLRRIP